MGGSAETRTVHSRPGLTLIRMATVGSCASASAEWSVALGAYSIADQPQTVSVGAAGSEGRIVNVGAGTDSTDAVNLGQLQAVIGALQAEVADLEARIDDLESFPPGPPPGVHE
jgi:hypothetical protein